MNICYCLQPEHSEAFWSIIVVTVSFLFYHFITTSISYETTIKKYFGKKKSKIQKIILQRLVGVFFFGLIPVAVILFFFDRPIAEYGMNIQNIIIIIKWIALIAPVIIIINILNAKKEDNLKMYPQIRKKKWTLGLLILSALSWIAYLFAYELMFRGFLLFGTCHAFGATMAIAITTSIYSLVHLPKGIKETIGAIPLGIILSILSLKTGNIWIAFAVHTVMALTNEWLSLWANPHMKLVK